MPGGGAFGGSTETPATEGTGYDRKVLEGGGEAEPVFDVGLKTRFIIIRADDDNDGDIHLGWDDDADDTNGFRLPPGSVFTATLDVSQQNIYAYPTSADDILWQMSMV